MRDLSIELLSVPAGWQDAHRYQLLVRDILQTVFHPTLELAEYELRGNDGADRRDIIFQNRCRSDTDYWTEIREKYGGEFPVFDAKNLSRPVGKSHVLSIAHYLKSYGCGLFGGLVVRKAEGKSGYYARREQWISHQKMIIVLNDHDLLEMLDRKSKGQDTDLYIARKIAEFRMSL
jgi:hypothetical protein